MSKRKSKKVEKAEVELKSDYCKDCKYYQRPRCNYYYIFVARKNCCDSFERSK